ncbi:MAG: adenosyl-hopene transferase HpnH [Armatimonadetes bacterium]|nr:adenosyl-hopene transferase HpnH [Armatimonadota bacterium]MDE2207686.1 adenosyl-hopene transferase HpnH [Armatimonadota bacterium]
MRYPIGFTLTQARHRSRMERSGQQRYPTVLMLEPLYTCNLACIGCAVERHTGKLKDRMTLEQCFKAVDDCGAPIINLCGGEPTLYPELPQLIEGLIQRGKYIILCTNALKLDTKVFDVIPPSSHLFLMIHLDGMKQTHDYVCNREGVFDTAIKMIKGARKRGYLTYINTTVFKETQVEEVEEMCKLVDKLRANGILISPGYEYDSVDADIFLSREQIHEKFQTIRQFSRRYKVNATPMFLEFAAGIRELPCAPWSTVNYTPNGWKAPCYLIGESHIATWQEFWEKTDWQYWESRKDARCSNCKMHSGFEHSAVSEAMKSVKGTIQLTAWALSK